MECNSLKTTNRESVKSYGSTSSASKRVDYEKLEVKHISDIVGDWGKWQRNYFIFHILCDMVAAANNVGYAFFAYDVDYWCEDVPVEFQNKTQQMKCFKFSNPNESCSKWRYDKSVFTSTIISEFDLVCDRSFLASMTQSFFMLGVVVSGLLFAYCSDKFGRQPVVWLGIIIEAVAGFSCVLSTNMVQYMFSRFLHGMASDGRAFATYSLMMESIGPKYRGDVGVLSNSGWIIGYVSIPCLAYFLRHFRWLQLCTTLPYIPLMIWFYTFSESPRWQITNGQFSKAKVVIRNALKQNSRSDEGLEQKLIQLKENLNTNQNEESLGNDKTALDLLKTPNMRKYTLIFWYSFGVVTFIYYGISLNINDFGGDLFLNFIIAGFVEVPSILICVVALRFIGRKTLTSGNLLATGILCLCIIPFTDSSSIAIRVPFVMGSKLCINSCFILIYMYAAEVFPTVLRNTGIGSSLVMGRIGAISAPFVKELGKNTSLAFVMILYAGLSIINAILVLFLPETKDREIPDTIQEAEQLGHNKNDLQSN